MPASNGRQREPDAVNPRRRGETIGDRCANCDARIGGNFCASCGQETTLALPPAGRFIREAAGRYVAFDGRFWRSLHALLFRPGFLTNEYLAGRRQRYVRPARLFVALSIALFAILRFSAGAPIVVDTAADARTAEAIVKGGDARNANAIDDDAAADAAGVGVRVDPDLNVSLDIGSWRMLAPLRSRIAGFNRLSREDKVERLFTGMLRYAPYAAIGLLPVFALLLQIAYAGRRRRYPSRPARYAAHLVFGAHNHAFAFLAASLFALIPFGPLRATLAIWTVLYAFASLKAVYGGRWSGTLVRGAFIAAVYSVCFVVAIAGLLLAAVTFG
jgi:hypothetical protein